MKILGLDVSTYVGMALVGEGEDRGKCVHFEKVKGFQRLSMIQAEVERILDIWKPEYAVIESYGYANHFSLVDLVEIGTVVRQALHRRKIPWFEVTPKTLKFWATGDGAAKKPKMAAVAKARWGFVSPSDDIVDAYTLGKMIDELGTDGLLKLKGVTVGC